MIWAQYIKIQFVEKCHNFIFLTIFCTAYSFSGKNLNFLCYNTINR